MSSVAASLDAPAVERPWAALTVCLLAVSMQMLDLTIVATALPALAVDLAVTGTMQVVVVAAYGLAFGSTLLTAARLRDRFGCRVMMIAGLTLFTLASGGCAAAQGAVELAAARAGQGLGAAAVAAQTILVLTAAFAPRRRMVAFGIYGAVAGVAGLAGPLVGGAILGVDPAGLGWRAIFLINLPVGVVAVVLASRSIHLGGGRSSLPLEMSSAALSVTGSALTLYTLAVVSVEGWSSTAAVSMSAGISLLVAFAVRQQRIIATGGTPLIGPELFADRGFAVGALVMLLFYGLFTALMFVVSVTVQTGLSWSAWRAGQLFLPFTIGAVFAAATTPVLAGRWGTRVLTLGLLLFAGAVFDLARTLDPSSSAIDVGELRISLFLAGLGMGLTVVPLPALMVATLDDRVTGAASGMAPTVQQFGSALGVGILGSVFFARVGDAAHATAPVFLGACRMVLWTVAALGFVAATLTTLMPRRPVAVR